MADEDVVAGIWLNLISKVNIDDRMTPQYLGFLRLVEPKGVLGETLYLEVPNDVTRNMIDMRMRPVLLDHLAANSEWGGPTNFAIVVNPSLEGETVPAAAAPIAASAEAASPISSVGSAVANNSVGAAAPVTSLANQNESSSRLNPNYTFESFVIGESNRMAHAAALACGEAPGKAYRPLFIYGNSGLGKTHLLHAIGHMAISLFPRIKVRYVNSEEFTNDFINAIQTNRVAAFHAEYRDVDVLLVDDIQFLQGKDQTQEAFFHTFNTLNDQQKQVVITSDLPPKQLNGFEDRMVSRFEWGLMTDIQAPALETRIAILRKKVERDRIRVTDDILEYIASRVTTNIRELEGSLTRVSAWASLNRKPIDMTLVQTVLKDLVAVAEDEVTTPVEIMNAVAAYYKISVDELTGKSRQQAIANARQIAMYLCREMTTLSLPKVGQLFGGKDHTTVMYAFRKVESMMKERLYFYNQVTEIHNSIKNKRS
jgi:chromosomal replication initiator protein